MRSSQRFTAEGSTFAMRAISSVSRWSQSFQPKVWASCEAMWGAPQPNSRSMVITRNMMRAAFGHPLLNSDAENRALVYCDSAARFGFFHEKRHRDHDQDRDTQEPETVHVREHRGLTRNRRLNQRPRNGRRRTASMGLNHLV